MGSTTHILYETQVISGQNKHDPALWLVVNQWTLHRPLASRPLENDDDVHRDSIGWRDLKRDGDN